MGGVAGIQFNDKFLQFAELHPEIPALQLDQNIREAFVSWIQGEANTLGGEDESGGSPNLYTRNG